MNNCYLPGQVFVCRMVLSVLAPLACLNAAAAAEPQKDPPPVEETRAVKFDPSFEKSLWGVQDPGKWQIHRTLHVNPRSAGADDHGPASAERPLKTIARAVEMAEPGTRILVYPGTYREGLAIRNSGDARQSRSGTASEPIIVEPKEPGTVILSGSDLWTDWKTESGSVYSAPWPNQWGFQRGGWMGEMVSPLGQRSEAVYVDELPLRQVLKREEMAQRTFCVDEEHGRIYIQLMDGEKTQHHRVDVLVRRDGLQVGDAWNKNSWPGHVVVRGIEFRHFDYNVFLGRHVLLEDCRFVWNCGRIDLGGEDYVVRRNTALHSGHGTFGTPPRRDDDPHVNGLLEDNAALYGNWRLGGYGKLNGWSMGGMKVMNTLNLIIRRANIQYNDCPGIWADTRCNNLLIEDSTITHNRMNGVWIEICNGETVLRNNTIAFNDTGLCISNTCHLTVEGNRFYGNGAQIGNWHASYGRGGFRSVGLKFINNAIVATSAQQMLVDLPGFDYIVPNSTFEGNLYFATGEQCFLLGQKPMDFAQWRGVFQQDKASIFSDAKFRDPEAMDFLPRADSPLLDRASWSKPMAAVRFSTGNRLYRTGEKATIAMRAEPDGTIRYTTDGTEPAANSTVYDKPLVLSKDTRIRAKVFGAYSPFNPAADASFVFLPEVPPLPQIALGDLKPVKATVGWGGQPAVNRSIMNRALTVGGRSFDQGIGAHAPSEIVYEIPNGATRFVALAGIDDEAMEGEKKATVAFEVWADQQRLLQSDVRRRGMPWIPVDVRIPSGSKQVRLVITDAGDGQEWDHADWLRAGFVHGE